MSAVTLLLVEWRNGDRTALDRLVPIVYRQLQDIARRELRGERQGHTLQPTALVHEVFLRLVGQREASWENRAQFFAVAAQLMRRILVDHARAHLAEKRGGAAPRVTLTDADGIGAAAADVELLGVDQALSRLAEFDPDQARVVELRYFAGLNVEETAHVLGWSPRTVKREWRTAKAWLFEQLKSE